MEKYATINGPISGAKYFIYTIYGKPIRNIFFTDSDAGDSTSGFAISNAINQYMIIDKKESIVRAFLFFACELYTPHSYDSASLPHEEIDEMSTWLSDIPQKFQLDIEARLIEHNVSLLSHEIIYANSLFFPVSSFVYESTTDLVPVVCDEEGWSLHIL